MRYRVKWYVECTAASFPQFGMAFMQFLRDQNWVYTGTMDVTAGVALLDGFFMTDQVEEPQFRQQVSAFARANGWRLGGSHNWEFYREVK